MISATDALRLPSAALKPTDAAHVERVLAHVEDKVLATMTRRGAAVPVAVDQGGGNLNPEILFEVSRRLRKLGWLSEWQQMGEKSNLTGKLVLTHFVLALAPADEAYAEVEKPVLTAVGD